MAIKPVRIEPFWQEKKKTRRKIPESVKEAVWAKYIGMDKTVGKCYVCNKPVHFTDFEVGHNRAISKGGSDKVTNLRPICRSCNRSMRNMSIEAYKKKYFSKPKPKKKTKKTKRRRKSPIERLVFG